MSHFFQITELQCLFVRERGHEMLQQGARCNRRSGQLLTVHRADPMSSRPSSQPGSGGGRSGYLIVGAATCRHRRSGTSACSRPRRREREADGSLRSEPCPCRAARGLRRALSPCAWSGTGGREHGLEQRVASYQKI